MGIMRQIKGHAGRKLAKNGYTLLETLIFISVSAVLFTSAIRVVSGQQDKAEFTYGVQEFSSRLRDIINDVSTGYYDYPPGTRCTVSGAAPPVITSVGGEQGTNSGCIFIGRVIHFGTDGVGGDNQGYQVFTVVGRRLHTDGKEVIDMNQTRPVPIDFDNQTGIMANGVRVEWVRVGGASFGAVGFFSDFTRFNTESRSLLETEARNVNMIPIPGTSINDNANQVRNRIRLISNGTPINPAAGIRACLESADERKRAIVTIGANLRTSGEDIQVENGRCEDAS